MLPLLRARFSSSLTFGLVTAAMGACSGPVGTEEATVAAASATATVNLGGCGVEVPATVAGTFDAARDAFKELILRRGPCPEVDGRPFQDSRSKANTQIPAIMRALTQRGCTRVGRNLVSEKGSYRSATRSDVDANDPNAFKMSGLDPRFVEVFQCGGTGVEQKIFLAGPEAAFHVIAFDPVAKAFDFYSTNEGTKQQAFVFHGSSFQQAKTSEIAARKAPFPDHACTTCHANGGLLLKELRFPWLNWQASPRAGASQLRDASTMNVLTGGGADVRIVEDLERDVLASQIAVNASRVGRIVGGRVDELNADANSTAPYTLKSLLAPLFCETEINIATSPTRLELGADGKPRAGSTQPIAVPPDLFLNRLLVPHGGRISLMDPTAASRLDVTGDADVEDFGALSTGVTVPQGSWLNTMKGLGVGVPADKSSDVSARRAGIFGDGLFPMPIAGRAFSNDDFIARLVQRGVLEEKFVVDVLMVDFPNPVFSKTRCDLLTAVPSVAVTGLTAAQITQKILASVDSLASSLPGAAELRANRAHTVEAHTQAVNAFTAKCKVNLPKRLAELYVLTVARRAHLFEDVSAPTRDFPKFAVEGFVRDQFFPRDLSVGPSMALSRALSTECTLIAR
jgi:hypothetical protein